MNWYDVGTIYHWENSFFLMSLQILKVYFVVLGIPLSPPSSISSPSSNRQKPNQTNKLKTETKLMKPLASMKTSINLKRFKGYILWKTAI